MRCHQCGSSKGPLCRIPHNRQLLLHIHSLQMLELCGQAHCSPLSPALSREYNSTRNRVHREPSNWRRDLKAGEWYWGDSTWDLRETRNSYIHALVLYNFLHCGVHQSTPDRGHAFFWFLMVVGTLSSICGTYFWTRTPEFKRSGTCISRSRPHDEQPVQWEDWFRKRDAWPTVQQSQPHGSAVDR